MYFANNDPGDGPKYDFTKVIFGRFKSRLRKGNKIQRDNPWTFDVCNRYLTDFRIRILPSKIILQPEFLNWSNL